MDMDANHMGLYTYVTEDNDIAMLDGGNDSQAFDSTPGSTLATTFDENNLRWLHDPELFQIELDSWFSEDGDIPLSGLEGAIRDTPTQTYNPVPNASSGNYGHGHQSEVVQAGLQADPDNTDVQNLEVDMDDDITSTVTTVDVTAPAQAQGLHSSSANPPPVSIPAVMFATHVNPNPAPFREQPQEVWDKVVGLLSVPDALNFYKSWVLRTRFDFGKVANSHPRLFINDDLVTRSEEYVSKTDVPSGVARIANPLGLTYSALIREARATGNIKLRDDLTFHRARDEGRRQNLSSAKVRIIIRKVLNNERRACYHCLGAGEMTFNYWGLILCASCAKAVLDENQKYSFSNLTKRYIWANPKWEPWLEAAFKRSTPAQAPRDFRDAIYRPDQVRRLVREQQPGATMQTLERRPSFPRAVLEENLAKYLYTGAIIERVVTWYKDGPEVLAHPVLDKACRSWLRVIMSSDWGERETIPYLTDLVKATRSAKSPPAIIVDAHDVNKKWAREEAADFLLWFLGSRLFTDRVNAFTREYVVFFKPGGEHRRYHGSYAAPHWMPVVLDHTRPTYIDPMQWPSFAQSLGVKTDAENLWAWYPRRGLQRTSPYGPRCIGYNWDAQAAESSTEASMTPQLTDSHDEDAIFMPYSPHSS